MSVFSLFCFYMEETQHASNKPISECKMLGIVSVKLITTVISCSHRRMFFFTGVFVSVNPSNRTSCIVIHPLTGPHGNTSAPETRAEFNLKSSHEDARYCIYYESDVR